MKTVIDQAHALRPRIERLLRAQAQLRRFPDHNRAPLFDVERAIDALAAGEPNGQSDVVERWVEAFLNSDGVA